mmetsp:Transcript_35859/g.53450  ORF Transcript_35859/g.53450 Transcript_35859/m.53450 type:complete len:121 (-) Transcript_35859:1104-1466(-)
MDYVFPSFFKIRCRSQNVAKFCECSDKFAVIPQHQGLGANSMEGLLTSPTGISFRCKRPVLQVQSFYLLKHEADRRDNMTTDRVVFTTADEAYWELGLSAGLDDDGQLTPTSTGDGEGGI